VAHDVANVAHCGHLRHRMVIHCAFVLCWPDAEPNANLKEHGSGGGIKAGSGRLSFSLTALNL